MVWVVLTGLVQSRLPTIWFWSAGRRCSFDFRVGPSSLRVFCRAWGTSFWHSSCCSDGRGPQRYHPSAERCDGCRNWCTTGAREGQRDTRGFGFWKSTFYGFEVQAGATQSIILPIPAPSKETDAWKQEHAEVVQTSECEAAKASREKTELLQEAGISVPDIKCFEASCCCGWSWGPEFPVVFQKLKDKFRLSWVSSRRAQVKEWQTEHAQEMALKDFEVDNAARLSEQLKQATAELEEQRQMQSQDCLSYVFYGEVNWSRWVQEIFALVSDDKLFQDHTEAAAREASQKKQLLEEVAEVERLNERRDMAWYEVGIRAAELIVLVVRFKNCKCFFLWFFLVLGYPLWGKPHWHVWPATRSNNPGQIFFLGCSAQKDGGRGEGGSGLFQSSFWS